MRKDRLGARLARLPTLLTSAAGAAEVARIVRPRPLPRRRLGTRVRPLLPDSLSVGLLLAIETKYVVARLGRELRSAKSFSLASRRPVTPPLVACGRHARLHTCLHLRDRRARDMACRAVAPLSRRSPERLVRPTVDGKPPLGRLLEETCLVRLTPYMGLRPLERPVRPLGRPAAQDKLNRKREYLPRPVRRLRLRGLGRRRALGARLMKAARPKLAPRKLAHLGREGLSKRQLRKVGKPVATPQTRPAARLTDASDMRPLGLILPLAVVAIKALAPDTQQLPLILTRGPRLALPPLAANGAEKLAIGLGRLGRKCLGPARKRDRYRRVRQVAFS